MSDTRDSTLRTEAIQDYVANQRDRLLKLCKELVEFETPSNEPGDFDDAFDYLQEQFSSLGFVTRRSPGNDTAGCLYARPLDRHHENPQLLLGHLDTVWATGTLKRRPFELNQDNETARGPGLFDMKAGLAQLILALECLDSLSVRPEMTPIVLINSDEEIGSPESKRWVRRLSRLSKRTLVLEPALGPEGKIKTARKGKGHFRIQIEGKASHAGLSPEEGSSAILELSHVIQKLHELNDPEEGITVNVGVIEGGTRSNVIAASSLAEVDVRVLTTEQAERLDNRIRSLVPEDSSTELTVTGGFDRPPMERTTRNHQLWKRIKQAGKGLNLDLEETRSGGASDGNTASQYTPTVDGLGAVGGGAHEENEFIKIDQTLERTALLARILMLD